MAQITMELRHVLEMEDFQLFDFPYKCDDPDWKKDLEQIIIDKFYFEEIGQETIDRFKHVFRTKMQSIMGYYNKLYNTTLLGGNPLTSYKLTEIFSGDSKTTGTQGQKVTHTDHPQTQDPAQDIPTSKQDLATENEQATDNTYSKTIEGYTRISYPELLKQHRANILRINSMIVNELKTCFILVY